MLVTKIHEYICRTGVKVQYWTSQTGFDIVVIQDGVVQSATYTEDKQQANELYLQRCKQFD